ncbi:MAG: hypothetical protein ACOCRU_02700, partial [bacterium]
YFQEGRITGEDDLKLLNMHLSRPVFQFHEVELNVLYNLDRESYVFMPAFNYSLTDSTTLCLELNYTDNEDSWDILPVSNKINAGMQVNF